MSNPTLKGIIAALATGLTLSACSTSSTDTLKPVETQILTDTSQIDLPLLAYFPTDDEKRLIQKATYRYQGQCAQRFGITVAAEESYIEPAVPQRRYGLINRDEVKTHGYHEAPYGGKTYEDGNSGQKDEGSEKAVTPQQLLRGEVMTGEAADGSRSTLTDSKGNPVPEGGCGKEGWDRLRGDVPHDYQEFPLGLMDEAMNLTYADPRYIEAEKEWSACMRKAGYEFEHIHEAGNSVQTKDEETQKAMALLEVDCSLEVNYPGRAMAVDVEYQYKLIKENEAQLRDALDKKNKLVANAKKAFK